MTDTPTEEEIALARDIVIANPTLRPVFGPNETGVRTVCMVCGTSRPFGSPHECMGPRPDLATVVAQALHAHARRAREEALREAAAVARSAGQPIRRDTLVVSDEIAEDILALIQEPEGR